MAEAAGDVKIFLTLDGVSYSTGMKKAAEQVKQLQGATTQAASVTRQQMADARGSVMVLGEEMGVHLPRHVQRFIATLPGVSSAMSAAFSAVAVIAIGVAIFEAAKKVVDFMQKTDEAARKNSQAWREISGSMQMTNDDLQVTNDKLENAIAKLEQKPQNGLKLAIDEAIQSADTLGTKLQADAQKIAETLRMQEPGLMARFFGTATSTTDITKRSQDLQSQLDAIDMTGRAHLQTLRKQGATQAEIDAATDALYAQRKAAIDKEMAQWAQPQLAAAQAERIREQGTGGPAGTHGGPDIQARLNILTAYIAALGRESDFIALSQTHGALEGKEAQAQAAHDAAEEGAKAWRIEFEREMKGMDERVRLFVDSSAKDREYRQRVFKTEAAGFPVEPPGGGKDIAAEMNQDLGRYGPRWQEYNDLIAKGSEEQAKLQMELALTKLRIQEATGVIGPHDVALAEAQIHARAYALDLKTLQEQLKSILADQSLSPEQQQTQAQKIQNQIGQLTGQYTIQAAQDQATINATTALGEFRKRLEETTREFTNLGGELSNVITGGLHSFNETLIKVLSTPSNMLRGTHPWRNLGAGVAESAGMASLKYGEGIAMKAIGSLFGLGKKGVTAPTGAAGQPFHVLVDNFGGAPGSTFGVGSILSYATGGAGGVMSSLGGISMLAGPLSSLFTGGAAGSIASASASGMGSLADAVADFTGGMQEGGVMHPGGFYLTGERGPELLQVGRTSRISSARETARLFGTGGGHTINIDARGANDPAAVHSAVHRAMQAYLPHLPAAAAAYTRDHNSRVPVGRRI